MVKDVYYGKTLRKSFARHEEVLEMPNLLEIQKKSYQWFLDTGLQEVFRDVAAIADYNGQPGAVLHRLHHGREAQVLLWRSARPGTPPTPPP